MIIQMNVIKMLYFIKKTLSALYSAHSQHNITAILLHHDELLSYDYNT